MMLYKHINNNNMVEAAGIEPASENHVARTSTCLVGGFNLALRTVHRQTFRNASSLDFRVGARTSSLSYPALVDASSPTDRRIRVKRAHN